MNRNKMQEKRQNNFKTPDISKMQEVIINARTRIYIRIDADPEEARSKYLARQEAKGKVVMVSRKPVAS
jgi:hypothetical protein